MIDAIASIASSLSSATVLTKALLGMKVDQEVISKVSALQTDIMTAQSAALSGLAERAALLRKIDELEGALREKTDWTKEIARYDLTTFPTGAHAYKLKDSDALGEPTHLICPSCFQRRKKSILQITRAIRGGQIVTCPECKTDLELIKSGPPPPVRRQRTNWMA